MKKKIIIFMPSIEGGGVEKNLFIVSNYLAQKLNGITLITISKKYANKFNKFVKLKTFKSSFWDNMPRRIKYFLSIYLLICEIFKDRNSVVFAFQANIYCILICKIFFIKIIVRSNSAPFGWATNPIKRKIFNLLLNKANKVMVNSFEFKKDIKKEFGVDATCIYNPLNTNEILKLSKKKSRNFFLKKKSLKIINIGRYTEQKDQITLIKSLKLIEKNINFEAIIVGKGILKNRLSEKIKNFKLEKNIKLVNFLKNPYPIIKQSDLIILSSRYEGLPNILLESLVLKKFIISSNCRTGPKEILNNGKGGFLFKVGDYRQLANKIIFFKKNRKKCQSMTLISYKNLYRFDMEKNLKKYYELVEKYL